MSEGRLARVQALLLERGLDVALISRSAHLRWLSGRQSDEVLLVKPDELSVLDPDEVAITDAVAGLRVGYDGPLVHREVLDRAAATEDLAVPMLQMRRTKDPDELRAIEASTAAVDAALVAAGTTVVEGASDVDVLAAAACELFRHGEGDVFVEANVGAGPAGADPDAKPCGRLLRSGETVFVDLYPRIGGYYGDATRAFAVGFVPERTRTLHVLLWQALDAAAERLLPGIPCASVDAACRAVLREAGYEVPHHIGHGFGVEQQELPWLVPDSRDVLRAGDVVTVEPGVYVDGWGRMRVEDAFVVGEDGPRRLNRVGRSLHPEEVPHA